MDKAEILQDISVDLSIMYKKALKNINKLDLRQKKNLQKHLLISKKKLMTYHHNPLNLYN